MRLVVDQGRNTKSWWLLLHLQELDFVTLVFPFVLVVDHLNEQKMDDISQNLKEQETNMIKFEAVEV